MAPLTAAEFARQADVSRETLERLSVYSELLTRWQARINLVGLATLADAWRRHFLDSAQLRPLVPSPPASLVDLGSGAGFPGLVLAILGQEPVTLVESNQKKCAFLREVARATGAKVDIVTERIEKFSPPTRFAIVTARALASLEKLLSWAQPLLATGGVCLFPKGETAEDELTVAAKTWHMSVERIASVSDAHGTILKIRDLKLRGHR